MFQIDSNIENHLPDMANFWLVKLDLRQRKQLLSPLRDTLRNLLCYHWRTDHPDGVRLHVIFKRLFSVLLSSGGKGMWATFKPKQ